MGVPKTEELTVLWGPIRSLLEGSFSFSHIKSIVGTAGLEVTRLAHLKQSGSGYASKGELMTEIDPAFIKLPGDEKNRFLVNVAEEMSRRRGQGVDEELERLLSRIGWPFVEGQLLPVRILDLSDLADVPVDAHTDLLKAAARVP